MNRELLERLESLKSRDVNTRAKLLEEGRLYGTYEQEMQDVHRENANALNEIISSHEWPGISEVGIEGSRAAWLVAQHAICTPELQRKFLQYLSKAAEAGDAPHKQVAFLTDRIRYNEGKPQVYGTVWDWNEHGKFTCELENPEKVNELRAQVGLPHSSNHVKRIERQLKPRVGNCQRIMRRISKRPQIGQRVWAGGNAGSGGDYEAATYGRQ